MQRRKSARVSAVQAAAPARTSRNAGDCRSRAFPNCGSPTGTIAFPPRSTLGVEVVELRVVRAPLGTEVHVVVKHPQRPMVEKEPNRPVGIDLGLHTFRRAEHPRPSGGPQSHKENPLQDQQIKEGRSLTSQEGDGSRQGAAHRKGNEPIRSDFRLAHQLLNTYDRIAVEDLNVSGMLRSKRFSKKMSEQRWETLCQILEHKAWKAGVRYVRVNPSHTSTDCSLCECTSVEVVVSSMCRDPNAAQNICARGFPTGNLGIGRDCQPM